MLAEQQSATAVPGLRRHDALMISSLAIGGPVFLYRIADGARTPLSRLVDTSMMYERPGHDEIWEWFEFAETLSRFDLATGNATVVATHVQNMDYRPRRMMPLLGRTATGSSSCRWIRPELRARRPNAPIPMMPRRRTGSTTADPATTRCGGTPAPMNRASVPACYFGWRFRGRRCFTFCGFRPMAIAETGHADHRNR